MTLLQQLIGKKWYGIIVGLLSLVAILYQAETGLFSGTGDSPVQPTAELDGTVLVVRVVDGDTFEIDGGERVRLIGVDTPETVKPNSPVECFGPESSAALRHLIEGQSIRLEKDKTDRDQYGRLLRYAYAGDVFVNEALVREGYARAVAYKPDTAMQAALVGAETTARQANIGRWSACPQ